MIYIFDLDGTLSFEGRNIDARIIDNIKKINQAENKIIFASARPIRDMLPLLESNFKVEFLIGGNGSIVKTSEGIEVVKKLDSTSFEKIKELIDTYDLDYLIDSDWEYSLKNRDNARANINDKVDALHLAKNVDLTTIEEAIKCNLLNIPNDIADKVYRILMKLPLSVVNHSDSSSIDITARDINKYSTFRKYFPKEEYIAFGNDANDIQLLKHAKISIVVGNNEAVKDIGDIRLSSNDEGIADYLSGYIS